MESSIICFSEFKNAIKQAGAELCQAQLSQKSQLKLSLKLEFNFHSGWVMVGGWVVVG